MLSTQLKLALIELDLPESLFSEKLIEELESRKIWNYFQILDILKFNISKKQKKATRIIEVNFDKFVVLNNLTVKDFGEGHKDADKIEKFTINKNLERQFFQEYFGLYTQIDEYVGKEVVSYLIPNYQVKLIPLKGDV